MPRVVNDSAVVAAYRVNRPDVIDEVIDGEAVMINLRTGTYYSLSPSGSVAWSALKHGATPAQLRTRLAQVYGVSEEAVDEDVTELLAEMERQELVTRAEADPDATDGTPVEQSQEPYARPRLDTFTDMEDLILLDPVHEVDQKKGWPHAAGPGADA